MKIKLRVNSLIVFSALALLLSTSALLATELVPEENTVKGDGPPPFEGAEAGARKLLDAIKAGDPKIAADFFFPEDAFDLVKDMAVPGRYHRKLVAWYDEDILSEHKRFKDPSWTFDGLELGRCKWKAKATEGNKLPYWSCRLNRVTARSGDRVRTLEIHVMINWGKAWYVTHLGKIRS